MIPLLVHTQFLVFVILDGLLREFQLLPVWQSLLLLLLVFSVALISGSEVAFFSLSPKQLAELKRSRSSSSHAILRLLADPRKLLATLLIANNFLTITIVILASIIIGEIFNFIQYPGLQFVFEVVIVSVIIVLFGEVMPKIYATRKSISLARFMAFPILMLDRVFAPLSFLLVSTTKLVDKRMQKRGYEISVDELTHAIDITSDISTAGDEKKILKGIVKFGNIDVRQIMRARIDVISFDYKTSFTQLVEKIRESGYSRVPVYENNFDKVLGIIYIKDVLPHLGSDDQFKWQSLLRQPYFVPESKKISDLLREFQKRKNHMDVVVDEYGGTSGIVTLEDILEEIVGEINDEFDDDEMVYSKLDEHTYVFEGKALLNDVCRIMELDRSILEASGLEADTLAGLILEIAGKIPRKNELVEFIPVTGEKDFTFKMESVDKRRIHRVKISFVDKPVSESESN